MKACVDTAQSVTDILNEPITENGLCSRVEVLFGNGHVAMLEAVSLRQNIERLASFAEELASGSGLIGNVIDFASRKPYQGGACAFSFEVVEDAAPGRNGTGYALLEASGPLSLIRRLEQAAVELLA